MGVFINNSYNLWNGGWYNSQHTTLENKSWNEVQVTLGTQSEKVPIISKKMYLKAGIYNMSATFIIDQGSIDGTSYKWFYIWKGSYNDKGEFISGARIDWYLELSTNKNSNKKLIIDEDTWVSFSFYPGSLGGTSSAFTDCIFTIKDVQLTRGEDKLPFKASGLIECDLTLGEDESETMLPISGSIQAKKEYVDLKQDGTGTNGGQYALVTIIDSNNADVSIHSQFCNQVDKYVVVIGALGNKFKVPAGKYTLSFNIKTYNTPKQSDGVTDLSRPNEFFIRNVTKNTWMDIIYIKYTAEIESQNIKRTFTLTEETELYFSWYASVGQATGTFPGWPENYKAELRNISLESVNEITEIN